MSLVYSWNSWGTVERMYALLVLIAVAMVIAGIYQIAKYREWVLGAALIIGGFLIGPGGWSIFNHNGV